MSSPATLAPLRLPSNAVWLVSGTSSGIGQSLISSILANSGYRIVALTRDPSSVSLPSRSNDGNTLVQKVDLRSEESIAIAFDAATAKFGRIDVVINNAGYGLSCEFEGTPTSAGREIFEINYWAAVHISRQALRVFREVNSLSGPVGGVIAQVSSAGGYIAVPGLTFYHSTKWALEGFTESLQKELDPDWQIRCVIFEPGGVKTKWWKENKKAFPRYPAYVREEGKKLGTEVIASMPAEVQNALSADSGDVANLMVKVVKDEDGMWGGRRLLRLPVGADAWILVKNDVQETRTNLEKWKNVSESTSPAGAKDALKAIGLLEG